MKEQFKWLAILASVLVSASAWAAEPSADETKIRQAVTSYVNAFNQGNAKALAALWSPEAVYTNPDSGEQVVGRAAIETQFASIFAAAKGAKLEATTESIQFVSPNVAIEQGTAKVLSAKGDPEESGYSAVYVKRDGEWLLDRVTEESPPVVQSNYEHLKSLEWMVGTWVDQDEQSTIETTCHWAKNQNFLVRSFTISARDRIKLSGMQIIGWDPAAKKIRSWVFDSNGGFGEGSWSKKGNAWHVQTSGTAADGRKVSSVNIITYVSNDQFTWQIVNGQIGDELLPNIDEVLVVRQKTE
ncbi:SnoaL-like domain protein [Anatilimnocola aggregata]|uniref:SnoaL-like domain protein n=1 Tax=Anatilimnocola aggregata TaxID=2528021 RepID=A0A517YAH2_9BACT|nr:SgcJ/EcaC family oxidoreductase [Anatilimnocola aggregata]QDU27152.1 SnoaL-like domain protein [Anatilimnocola aggregata]